MRGLSASFMTALKGGILRPFLNLAIADHTLQMSIRDNYINLYYRGGSLLRITQDGQTYKASFDPNYLKSNEKERKELLQELNAGELDENAIDTWLEIIPHQKFDMDLYFGRKTKPEREYQQLVAYENNLGRIAAATDYFICDIEYADVHSRGRFDMVAAYWPSSGPARKNNTNIGLSLIEMKYGHGALRGTSGMQDHIRKMNLFLSDASNIRALKKEMATVFNQLRELGLVKNQKDIAKFNEDKPEYVFILANVDPASRILSDELDKLPPMPNADMKFAVSTFMGYGLFRENVLSLKEFRTKFSV